MTEGTGRVSAVSLAAEVDAMLAAAQPSGVPELAGETPLDVVFAVPENASGLRDARDTLEGIALSKMPAAAQAAVASNRRGTGDEADLDRVIAELMASEGIPKPRYAPNFAKDQDTSLESITVIGRTNHPYSGFEKFGYYQHDRALHTHLIGQTGGGKSTLLENIVYQDIWFGRGGMYIDPHGDSAVRMLHHVPPWRIKDTIYIDFGSKENLVGLNALEIFDVTSAEERQDAVDTTIDLLRRAVGLDDTAVRLMNYLRKALASLAFVPESPDSTHSGMTLMEIMPLFLNAGFRESVKRYITDESLRDWWNQTFESKGGVKVIEETQSLENRLSPILNNMYLTGVLGQSRTTLDLADIMDSGKFIIVNLSRAGTSDTFRKMVGSILVSKVLKAALGRQLRMPEEKRLRFALIIDEFQNFVTKDFAAILEEARKYGLSLTVAHQSMGQLDDEPKLVKTLGTNVANRLVYGVGHDDAVKMENYMQPLTRKSLENLPTFHIAAKLMIDRHRDFPAFSAKTLPPMQMFRSHDRIAEIIARRSERLYTRPIAMAAAAYEERKALGRETIEFLGRDDSEFVVL